MKSAVRNSVGMTLITVLVALGLISIISAGLMTLITSSVQGQKYVQNRQAALSVQLGVFGLLSDRATCTANFANINMVQPMPIMLPNQLVNSDRSQRIFEVGQVYEMNSVRLLGFRFSRFQRYAASGSEYYRGPAELQIHIESIGASGPREIIRTTNIFLELKGKTTGPGPNADEIETCIAVGNDQNNIWMQKPNGDIYYNLGRVGVGITNPTGVDPRQTFHVEGTALVVGTLAVNGNIYAGQFMYNTSDERMKKEIQPAPGLQALEKLDGVQFLWNDTNQKSYGVIAQDVEKIFPAMVGVNETTGMKAVDYHQMVGPIIQSIKELSNENKKLRAEQEVLRREVQTLKTRLRQTGAGSE